MDADGGREVGQRGSGPEARNNRRDACATHEFDMSEPTNKEAKRFRFVPEITLGNVLQLVTLGAAVVGLWMNMDRRISAVELRTSFSEEERRDMKRNLETLTATQATLARTVDRLSILFEQHTKETK
jgi:hypothetical protein